MPRIQEKQANKYDVLFKFLNKIGDDI